MTATPRLRRLTTVSTAALFHAFDYRFAVAAESPLALEFLRRLYGSCVNQGTELSGERFSLERREGDRRRSWEVYHGAERLAGELSLGAALNHLEYQICLQIIDNNPNLIALHGATVLTASGAAFISGPSGAGKTTLSLALAARGYRVGGDDVALLDPRTHTIRPLPRCFHLDARSRRLLRNVGLSMPARTLRYAFMTPMDLGTRHAPASPVRLLLYLGRAENRRSQLQELSQGEMIVRLLSETPRGARSPNEILAALRPLVCASACYYLLRGRLSDTAETVAALLGPA